MGDNKEKELSYEELLSKCNLLEEERNKRLKGELLVADAKSLVDEENARIKTIQKFVSTALTLKDETTIIESALESILETFECENAYYLKIDQDNQTLKIVGDLQEELIGKNLPIPTEMSRFQECFLLFENEHWPEDWQKTLSLHRGIGAFYTNKNDEIEGLIIAGNSEEGNRIYRPIRDTYISCGSSKSNRNRAK